MNKEYAVLTSKLDGLKKRLKRINKVSAKLGVTPVTLTALGTYVEVDRDATVKARREYWDAPDVLRERTTIRIEGETPKLDGGYTFIARIDPDGIVYGAPDAPDVPDALVDRRGSCDHCHLDRKRTATFVVADSEGNMALVGRNCLGDFLGAFANDPHSVWKYLEDWEILTSEGANEATFGSAGDVMHSPLDVLTATYQIIRAYGWLGAGVAYQNPGLGTPTASHVRTLLHDIDGKRLADIKRDIASIEIDTDRIESALNWARTNDGKGDYIRNIRSLANGDAVSYKQIGFVASIIPAYDKSVQWETERFQKAQAKADRPESNWIGKVGERVTILGARLDSMRELYSDWGVSFLLKFTDASGNDITWFASRDDICEVGETVDMKATIKRLDTYNNRKQTIINRAKAVR